MDLTGKMVLVGCIAMVFKDSKTVFLTLGLLYIGLKSVKSGLVGEMGLTDWIAMVYRVYQNRYPTLERYL